MDEAPSSNSPGSHPRPECFYQLLGVDRCAIDEDIKRAYRQMSLQYHPDRNSSDEKAKEKFQKIAAAYEVLSNPELRTIYSRWGFQGLKDYKKLDSVWYGGLMKRVIKLFMN